jgi:hypothetical protein
VLPTTSFGVFVCGRVVSNLFDDLLDRWDRLRRRRYRPRLRGARSVTLYSLALGVALALGVFASLAASRASTDSTEADFRTGLDSGTGETITQTITRNGKTQRVVRYRTKAGLIVYETLPGRQQTLLLPGQTFQETQTQVDTRTITKTVTDVVTVTEPPVTVTNTVTVIETVTQTVTEPASPP